MDFDCPAKTVKEEVLQGAIVTAVNNAYARRNTVISLLKTNIEETLFDDLEAGIAAVDTQLIRYNKLRKLNSGKKIRLAVSGRMKLRHTILKGDSKPCPRKLYN